MLRSLLFLAFLTSSSLHAQQSVPYAVTKSPWNADSLGNHRVVLHVSGEGKYARANFYWRRRDERPDMKRIIVQDAKNGMRVMNTMVISNNNEWCDILFEPISGKGSYFLYYMPSRNEGRSNYPRGTYWKPDTTATAEWTHGITTGIAANTTADLIESIDALNSFDPMEVIATEKETKDLITRSGKTDFLIFPEDREHPIRMPDRLPYRWVATPVKAGFSGAAAKGEHYSFQLGLYALKSLKDLTVTTGELVSKTGKRIGKERITCFNTHGIDYTGKAFDKTIDVEQGLVQALWFGIEVPKDAATGDYTGTVTIRAGNAAPVKVPMDIRVNDKVLADGGISDPEKQTRLHWLNSTLAQENTVIAPYTPLRVNGSTISLLGRKLILGSDGLPAKIQTFFTPEMTAMQNDANDVLAAPIRLRIVDVRGNTMSMGPVGAPTMKKSDGTVTWQVKSGNGTIRMDVSGKIEFDGFLTYRIKVVALKDQELNDIALDIPFSPSAATYMMGLGRKGGVMPEKVDWHWKVDSANQDGAWIGSVNAGLQYSLRDEKYSRPLNTNFYLQKPLLLPRSWGNDDKGGIRISRVGNAIVANNYSGARKMAKGDSLFYDMTMLITPFHTLNTDFQWANRFYHKYDNLDTIKAKGATLINIHHATPINPWINYPFIEWRKMKGYIDSAHAMGLKVKIYNTVRELSNHAYETFPMRSLGHEIYSPGKGGGFSWLQEHVGKDYIAAWFVPEIKDAAIVNSGMSRWHNYYVEGMNWLTQQVGIDGIYLDDVAFDRVTMKRIKRVLTKDGHPGIIDLHSANQYNKNDGFNNSANLYMEHFPYLNRLWFGEYFDYEKNGPDFFLTESSGIPFGLMGEMLEGGGNPWRGMVYGMTNRMPWSGQVGPGAIWKVWDAFGMKGTEMIGYWSPNCPVKADKDMVKVTVYKKAGKTLVSLASWEAADTETRLNIDWKSLGIDPSRATITAPAVDGFQPGRTFRADEAIPVEKGKGWLLVLQ